MLLRFDLARSGRPVGSKTFSGRARSGVFRVNFLGFRVFPDHIARSKNNQRFTIDLLTFPMFLLVRGIFRRGPTVEALKIFIVA